MRPVERQTHLPGISRLLDLVPIASKKRKEKKREKERIENLKDAVINKIFYALRTNGITQVFKWSESLRQENESAVPDRREKRPISPGKIESREIHVFFRYTDETTQKVIQADVHLNQQ